ncbi:5,6-dimethylbenzimidazole synthase [Yoonia sediminilitoris]|uniref:Cob(II)yrinic acid a,c-diamide reductase n=1 Tax=Yoonia sediminilitoris TaxID=1286148 RepID=A0A2T6KI57_9RHOB|nr:5,6-dimethylbenzimidazole synthase [Yoonia sediminilitoris]PUB15409.1 cob(II)yrinic acid a,c-diamide reductase [Yoonia sediminilitoris]RCW96019.1 cob(II)yrinic acid a,c-diamide reductase [Yoonia sediminilitoris]
MEFGTAHQDVLHDILRWRRDVRHFKPDPLPRAALEKLRAAMDLAPSVGNARPWRVLQVTTDSLRKAVIDNFEAANREAARIYDTEKRAAYDKLKLAGLRDAPVHLAIFTDHQPAEGHGLGRQTMPEMLDYSTVAAIHTLWLAARAQNIGVGWVSILDPSAIARTLNVPETWSLTAYLCVGYPQSSDDTPLLERKHWQDHTESHWQEV